MSGRMKKAVALVLAVLLTVLIMPEPAAAVASFAPIQCEAAILVDAATGTVLYEQDADKQILPASTTKVMTALLVFEAVERGEISLDDEVTATQEIIDGVIYDASRTSPYITDGEIMTVRQYLYCLLLESDCVACDILAAHISGSVEAFVAQMNRRAAELGCSDTVFMNTHGYPTEGHYTTARSLYLMLAEALEYPEFVEIFSTIKTVLPATNLNPERKLHNSDWMIWNPEKIESIYTRYYYEYAVGGKTGSSNASGRCLISCAEKDGQMLICALIGARSGEIEGEGWTITCFSESERLYEWGFNNFELVSVAQKGAELAIAEVTGSPVSRIALRLGEDAVALVERGGSAGVSARYVLPEEAVAAPVSSGDVIGSIEVSVNGEPVGSYPLCAAQDAPLERTGRQKKTTSAALRTVIIIAAVLVMLFALALLYVTNKQGILLDKYFAGKKGGKKNEKHDPVLHKERRKVPDAPPRKKAKRH